MSAILTELAHVHVAHAMTARALLTQLLPGDHVGVATRAGNLLVATGQLPVAVMGVIEAGVLPRFVVVAPSAVLAESARMSILALVAAVALLGNLLLEISASVAVLTVDLRVRSQQRKPGFLRVIELRRLPPGGCVAVVALGPTATAMHVIRGMAGHAAGWRVLVALCEMTAAAGHLDVTIM